MQNSRTAGHLRYAEYGLLVIIIGLLVLFFLDKYKAVHKYAERQAVLGIINQMRGETVAAARNFQPSINSGGVEETRNPVGIMQKQPPHYLGSISSPQKVDVQPGSWYYNAQGGFLVYKAKYKHEFPFRKQAVKKIRLALLPLEEAEGNRTVNILTCGAKICLTVLDKHR